MTDQDAVLDQDEQEESDSPEEELSEDQKLMAELKEAISVEREQIGALRVKLTVSVPRDLVERRMGKQFAELKREALVPGFRKGHAPIRLVEKRFGTDVGEQLKSQLIGSGYLAAVEKEDIKALGDPLFWVKTKEERLGEDQKPRTVEVEKLVAFDKAIDHLPMPKEGSLSFSCELELKPQFKLPTLEKIRVERPAVTIDDDDVDVELKRMQMRRGTFQPVEDGPVEADDMLYVNMKMSVGEETIASEDNFDIAARDIRIKGVPLVGLGDKLVGKKLGDELSFQAPVPDDHENIDLRGKKARFDFVIREIKRLEVPPVDEELLSSLGFEGEDELRAAIRSTLESELDRTIKMKMYDQVGSYLLDHTTLDIPEGLSQRQTDRAMARRMIELLQMGVPPAEIDRARDEMGAKAREQAVRDLKLYFILEKIAEEREIEVREDEINGAIAQIARRTGKRFDRVRDDLSKRDGLSNLYLQLRDQKVFDMLLETAEVTEVEGPKKKPSTKASPAKPSATKPTPPKVASAKTAAPKAPPPKTAKSAKTAKPKAEPKKEVKTVSRAAPKTAPKPAMRRKGSKRGG